AFGLIEAHRAQSGLAQPRHFAGCQPLIGGIVPAPITCLVHASESNDEHREAVLCASSVQPSRNRPGRSADRGAYGPETFGLAPIPAQARLLARRKTRPMN